MSRRAWPFAGDSPVARARKMALAYRQTAIELQTELHETLDTVAKMDPRVAGWVDSDQFKQLHNRASNPARPERVAELDQRFYEWGEEWQGAIRRAYDDDEMITSQEAAGILEVAGNTVGRMRMRGRIAGEFIQHPGDPTGRWYYKASDVYALSRDRRRRSSHETKSTDTVQGADEVTPHDR